MYKFIVSLILAISFLVSPGVQADMVTRYTDAQKSSYMALAGPSEWGLIGSADFEKEKAPYSNFFTMTNLLDQYRDEEHQVGNIQGTYTMNSWDGMGAGYSHTLHGLEATGLSFSHNSANQFGIQLPVSNISAFYLNIGTHANESSTQGTFNITIAALDSYGQQAYQTFNNVPIGFAGFILDDGYFLTGFELTTNGNKNTGYYFNVVLGDGSGAVPEPATLAILGLGLAGLGLARARRKK